MKSLSPADFAEMPEDELAEKREAVSLLESARAGKLPLGLEGSRVLSPEEDRYGENDYYELRKIQVKWHDKLVNMTKIAVASKVEAVAAKKNAMTDGLTGLANKASFSQALPSAVERANRTNRNVYLVMMDIDFFKLVNDKHGHMAGDKVLKDLADLLTERSRTNEKPFRWGGEEFAVILDADNDVKAKVFCEGIRKKVENHEFDLGNGVVLNKKTNGVVDASNRLTVSVGYGPVAINMGELSREIPVSDSSADITKEQMQGEIVLKLVDKALYAAKAGGRNRVVKVGSKEYLTFQRDAKAKEKLDRKNEIAQGGSTGNKPENQV